jgi:hypothetical protein
MTVVDVLGAVHGSHSHAEVRAMHRRYGFRWSAHFDLRCGPAPKDI